MANTQVILIEPIAGLGAEADVVKVRSGFARNFLVPHGKACYVTQGNLRHVNTLKAKRAEREARELNESEELARRINKVRLTIILETGETGKSFGAITANDIADRLKGELGGLVIDRHRLVLEHPIKSSGEFEIPVKLHADVTAKLTLTVKPSAAPAAEGEAADAEPARKPRTTRPAR